MRIVYIYFIIFSTTLFSCQNLTGNVSVDFQKKQPVNSMVGFLHFNDIHKLEADIKELKPKYWRFRYTDHTVDDVKVLLKNDVTPIIVVSDKYGYPDNPNWKSPLKSDGYKNVTKDIYLALGNKVIYDPWNEPYLTGFDRAFSEDFYKAFKQCHDMIRSLPGGQNAMITGPAFEQFKKSEVEDFFKFCKKNNIKLDILSWHDWRNDSDLENVQSDIDWVKNEILPKYPSLGVKKIILTEVIHATIQFSPTQIYKVYDALEKSRIDGACRGCFIETNGIVNCENNSMTGLLDQNGNPRSVWWATKLYSQSVNNRVYSSTDQKNLVSFASYDVNGAYLLLANNYSDKILKTNISLSNIFQLPYFKNSNTVRLNIYKIPTTGEKALEKPIFISSKKIKLSKQNLKLEIKDINFQEVYYLTFTK